MEVVIIFKCRPNSRVLLFWCNLCLVFWTKYILKVGWLNLFMLAGFWVTLLCYIYFWWDGVFSVKLLLCCFSLYDCWSFNELHSGCRWSVVFPSMCGQVVYLYLVSCLVWYGPAALQLVPRWCCIPFFLLLCQSYFCWDAPICLIWYELYPL